MPAGLFREWEKAALWLKEGRRIALATVIRTWGSSPRPLGSVLVVRDDGAFEGSVSGGCVEGAVVVEAIEALKRRAPKILDFKAGEDDVWAPGLSCGGRISIFLNPIGEEQETIVHQVRRSLDQGHPGILVNGLANGEVDFLTTDSGRGVVFPPEIYIMAGKFLSARKSQTISAYGEEIFLNFIPPLQRLYIVGAVHVAQSLVPMARMCGFQVFLIDPREAFADPARFPGQEIKIDSPEDFLAGQQLNSECAFVTLTHDPKLDEPGLKIALEAECFYIGALGSRKTHEARLKNLKNAGLSSGQVKRISGPVGLSIGAKTPQEIAVSILAELIAALRGQESDSR